MINVKSTLTYKALAIFGHSLKDFLITLGNVGKDFSRVFYYILKLIINVKATIEQSSRFAVEFAHYINHCKHDKHYYCNDYCNQFFGFAVNGSFLPDNLIKFTDNIEQAFIFLFKLVYSLAVKYSIHNIHPFSSILWN